MRAASHIYPCKQVFSDKDVSKLCPAEKTSYWKINPESESFSDLQRCQTRFLVKSWERLLLDLELRNRANAVVL